jgi:hypothetical protein
MKQETKPRVVSIKARKLKKRAPPSAKDYKFLETRE